MQPHPFYVTWINIHSFWLYWYQPHISYTYFFTMVYIVFLKVETDAGTFQTCFYCTEQVTREVCPYGEREVFQKMSRFRDKQFGIKTSFSKHQGIWSSQRESWCQQQCCRFADETGCECSLWVAISESTCVLNNSRGLSNLWGVWLVIQLRSLAPIGFHLTTSWLGILVCRLQLGSVRLPLRTA